MQGTTNTPFLQNDVSIILQGVKAALAKFPRLRNPVSRARLFKNSNSEPKVIKPKLYYRIAPAFERPQTKAKRVKRELLDAGATVYGLLKAESRYLPKVLHDNEHIEAVIYGQHNSSSAMLVATDERILYVDKKPMVVMSDEVSYEVISGVQFDVHTLFATVVLHTPVKNYEFKCVNLHCAEKFSRHIEKHRLEREHKEPESVIEILPNSARKPKISEIHELNDMAGYYWLPTDEEERRKVQQVVS